MKFLINLIYNSGFQWYYNQSIYIKGYSFSPAGDYLEGEALLNYVSNNIKKERSVIDIIKKLNGVYSLIYLQEDNIYIFCDKTRFFPLFYRFYDHVLKISDSPELLRLENDRPEYLAYHEFQCSGFVTNNKTLINNIFQIKASELLNLNKKHVSSQIIYTYRVELKELMNFKNPVDELKLKIDNAFSRLAISLKGKTPVLPLSGGFDSRLIACKLKEMEFDNTICFTYGRQSAETELSKKVAEKLGFKWYFIDYKKEMINRNLLLEEDFNDYYKFASRYTSMFYLQEFPATKYLKSRNLIPDNSVFIPGHSGDLLGGSQFAKVFSSDIKISSVSSKIFKSKFFLYPAKRKIRKEIIDSIKEQVGDVKSDTAVYSVLEDWDIKEKIAKYIFNSSQVFVYFGYQVRFPFWDNELFEFFRTLSPEYKNGKQLYDSCLKDKYFEKYRVNFNNELTYSIFQIKFQSIKEKIKSYLPKYIKKINILKNDWCCYYEMSKPMYDEIPFKIKKHLPYSNYNSVLINWYLTKIFKSEIR
jgi:asparagine synthase (glutamine-hydrolysing)